MAVIAGRLGCIVAKPRPAVIRPLAIIHRTTPLTPAAERFVEMARTGAHPKPDDPSMARSERTSDRATTGPEP